MKKLVFLPILTNIRRGWGSVDMGVVTYLVVLPVRFRLLNSLHVYDVKQSYLYIFNQWSDPVLWTHIVAQWNSKKMSTTTYI